MSRPRMPRIASAPLVALVERRGGIAAAARAQNVDSPALRRAYMRAKAEGSLTWTEADRMAVQVMGRHPSTIFGRALVVTVIADAFPSFKVARAQTLRGTVLYASCDTCPWTSITDNAAELAAELERHDHIAVVPVNGGDQLVML